LIEEYQTNETGRENGQPVLHEVGEWVATDGVVVRTIGRELRGRKAVEVIVRLRIVGKTEIGPFGKKLV
jgi:hypothetical protein